jgi:hypothetical protein
MKKIAVLATAILSTTPVMGDGIIKSFMKSLSDSEDLSKKYEGVQKKKIGGSNLYIWKLTPKGRSVSTSNAVDKPSLVIDSVDTADSIPIEDNTISRNQKVDEEGYKAQQTSRSLIYDEGNPLEDSGVADAWRKAHEAEERLAAHREYMEKLRVSRKKEERAKKKDARSAESTRRSTDG